MSHYSSALNIDEDPLFDPNAFGMATLLGGLFVMGIAADLIANSDDKDSLLWLLEYVGVGLIILSIISFSYSFIRCINISEHRSLIIEHYHHHHYHRTYRPIPSIKDSRLSPTDMLTSPPKLPTYGSTKQTTRQQQESNRSMQIIVE